jgi:hypothetical protein
MNNFEREKREDYEAYLQNRKLLEKAATDKRASTYLAMAEAASLEIGGRFRQVSPMSITGTTPIPHPHLPAPSWAGQDNGVEPALGYEIDAQEPVGEPFEQEAAQRILEDRQVAAAAFPSAADDSGASEALTVISPTDVQPDAPLLHSNSSALLAPAASSTGGAEVGTAPPIHSRSAGGAASTPAVRGGPAPEEVQRAGPRSFRRRL